MIDPPQRNTRALFMLDTRRNIAHLLEILSTNFETTEDAC